MKKVRCNIEVMYVLVVAPLLKLEPAPLVLTGHTFLNVYILVLDTVAQGTDNVIRALGDHCLSSIQLHVGSAEKSVEMELRLLTFEFSPIQILLNFICEHMLRRGCIAPLHTQVKDI